MANPANPLGDAVMSITRKPRVFPTEERYTPYLRGSHKVTGLLVSGSARAM